jgi:hypothetical protein
MKTLITQIRSKLSEASPQAYKMAMIFMGILLMTDIASANPVKTILMSELASSLVKWVGYPIGIVIFADALIDAIRGQGKGFLGQTLSAVLVFGLAAYYQEIVGAIFNLIQ